ncbi:MAG: hypothetical protein JWR75_2081 [Devosia sp.]|nr:hypothetical protein [Devosia sp.]
MGLRLFLHAVRLVFDNLQYAFRISILLYFVPAIAAYSLLSGADVASPSPLAVLVSFLAGLGSLWIAVAWHRFILLDELPVGWLPRFHGDRILAYFGWSLVLSLLSIPVVLLVALLVSPVALLGGTLGAVLIFPVIVFILMVVLYRLALILPAAAIKRPLRLGEAWNATRGASGDILALAFISAIAALVISIPSMMLVGSLRPLGIIWEAATSWLALLVGVGIITTLYGHYIEGRPLPSKTTPITSTTL